MSGLNRQLFAIASAGIAAGTLAACSPRYNSESDCLKVSGRVESEETHLGVMVPARVKQVNVCEGQAVHKGQLLLQLDDTQLESGLKDAEAILNAANEEQEKTYELLNVMKRHTSSRPIAHLKGTDHDAVKDRGARLEVHKTARAVPQDVILSSDDLETGDFKADLQNELKLQEKQLDEMQSAQEAMLKQSEQQAEDALAEAYKAEKSALSETTGVLKSQTRASQRIWIWPLNKLSDAKQAAIDDVAKTKQAAIDSAYESKKSSIAAGYSAQQKALEQSLKDRRTALEDSFKAKLSNVEQIHRTQEKMFAEMNKSQSVLQQRVGQLSEIAKFSSPLQSAVLAQSNMLTLQRQEIEARLAAIASEVAKARATRDDLIAKRDAFKIVSPCNGVCSGLNIREGETAVPGQTLIKVTDTNNAYVRTFVPEKCIGKVSVGERAKVFFDSDPETPFDARVVSIDSQASFTPENVYFHDDRVRQVFGVKLTISKAGNIAKPGMPADAQIYLKPETL